jgi:hypothetical protein
MSILVPRPRQALDGTQYGGTQPTDISRINRRSYWSRSCPATLSAGDESLTNVSAYDPATCADRCAVGGLLGGLDSASHAVTESQVTRSITTKRVSFAGELLDKSKSYQRRASAAAAHDSMAADGCRPLFGGLSIGCHVQPTLRAYS